MTIKQRHPLNKNMFVLLMLFIISSAVLVSVSGQQHQRQQQQQRHSKDEMDDIERKFEHERATNPNFFKEKDSFEKAKMIGGWNYRYHHRRHRNSNSNSHVSTRDNSKHRNKNNTYHLEKSRTFLEYALRTYRWQLVSRMISPKFLEVMKPIADKIEDDYNTVVNEITSAVSSGGYNQGVDGNDNAGTDTECNASTNTDTNTCGGYYRSNNNNDDDAKLDWTDPIFLRVGWENDPIVVESHKLIFFIISKNASTQFRILLRRMTGLHNRHDDNENENDSDNDNENETPTLFSSLRQAEIDDWDDLRNRVWDPSRNGLKHLGDYSRKQQREFMLSDEWTRAVFVRDPLERLVSAYKYMAMTKEPSNKQNKPNNRPDSDNVVGGIIKQNCCSMNPMRPLGLSDENHKHCSKMPSYYTPLTDENFPFNLFVEHILPKCFDLHWMMQSKRMSPKSWNQINFVGRFDSLKDDTHDLLKRIGAFDEFGRQGWGPNNEAIFETNTATHATNTYLSKTEEIWSRYYFEPSDSDGSDDKGDNSDSKTMSAVGRLALDYYRKDYDFVLSDSESLFRQDPRS